MDIPIIYEDDILMVVDKPYSVIVNRSENAKENTVADWAESRIDILRNTGGGKTDGNSDFYLRNGIVHRIDRDTSGLLLIAKNPDVFLRLQKQFQDRGVEKKYFALVHGRVEENKGCINAPIARNPSNRRICSVVPFGKDAVTNYRVISYHRDLQDNKYTYLEVSPKTGRMHQIRVHMKYRGFPLVSDRLYAGRKVYKNDMELCPRLFLHAYFLRFMHPVKSELMNIEIPLPSDLRTVFDRLRMED